MFSTETIAALAVGGVLAIVIPIIAIIVFKLKNRDLWLPSMLIGAATFIVFAMILEQILHTVMLPIVKENVIAYSIYGALAAGIFEEMGRFVAYKTLMKKHYSTKNAVLMGLGHGGCEAIMLLGITLITYLILALAANTMGIDNLLEQTAGGNPEVMETARTQIETIRGYNFSSCAMGLFERIIAMIFHVCMSVFVYKAVTQKGRLWLFPTAILLHALLDFPAVLYQINVITSIPIVYVVMTAFTAIIVIVTVMMSKKLKD